MSETVKEIFLEKKYEKTKVLGTFLGKDHIDQIIDFDCDVYKPNNSLGGDPRDESNILLKFRKNVFPKEELKDAYVGLRDAAQESQNRGLAAGPKGDKLQNRDWVTSEQLEILNYFADSYNVLDMDIDPVQEIIDKYKDGKKDETRGSVWLRNKLKENNFVFWDWVENARKEHPENPEKVSEEAKHILREYVSTTTYANPVRSGIAGYFGRYPRIPYCRLTSYTASKTQKWKKAVPFIENVSDWFHDLVPGRYENQKKFCEKLDDHFIIGNSVFTTITVNKNFRTAAHRDAGDLNDGFGNMICLGNSKYDGGLLIFPEYRVAVDLRPGDAFLFDPHEIHGNTEIVPHEGHIDDFERITCVLYAREDMSSCESITVERLRKQFVDDRRKNKDHPEWRPGWNGVSADMWESEEWIEYLYQNGMHEYVAENFESEDSKTSLEDFF